MERGRLVRGAIGLHGLAGSVSNHAPRFGFSVISCDRIPRCKGC